MEKAIFSIFGIKYHSGLHLVAGIQGTPFSRQEVMYPLQQSPLPLHSQSDHVLNSLIVKKMDLD